MTERARGRGPGKGRGKGRAKRPRRPSLPPDVVSDVRTTARRGQTDLVLSLLEQAAEAMERGRPIEAERAAAQAKSLAPRSAAVREALGLALYQLERFRDALRELQAYRRMSGRRDQNHLIADCHRALGAPAKAVPLVQEALRSRIPEEARAEAAVVGAAALADLGRYEEAIGLLRRFQTEPERAADHDLRVWYVLGDVLERAGRPEEAAEAFRRIIRHDPEAFDTAERLARLA